MSNVSRNKRVINFIYRRISKDLLNNKKEGLVNSLSPIKAILFLLSGNCLLIKYDSKSVLGIFSYVVKKVESTIGLRCSGGDKKGQI